MFVWWHHYFFIFPSEKKLIWPKTCSIVCHVVNPSDTSSRWKNEGRDWDIELVQFCYISNKHQKMPVLFVQDFINFVRPMSPLCLQHDHSSWRNSEIRFCYYRNRATDDIHFSLFLKKQLQNSDKNNKEC